MFFENIMKIFTIIFYNFSLAFKVSLLPEAILLINASNFIGALKAFKLISLIWASIGDGGEADN